jgi:hypothetical protein
VDRLAVKGGTSEITLKVETEFKCFTVWLKLFTVQWKTMSRGLTADVDLEGKVAQVTFIINHRV